MTFKLEHIANMIFLTADQDVIFKAWDETEFTERKFQNQLKKLERDLNGDIKVIRTF